MKGLIQIVFLLFVSIGVKAQTDTSYFYSDNTQVRVGDFKNASYYEVTDSASRNGKINRFYANHSLYGVASYKNDELHGPYITYYKNGNVKESGLYDLSKPVGLRKRRYENGSMRSVEAMTNKEMDLVSPKMITAWHANGEIMIEKGVGNFEATNFDNPSLLEKGRIDGGNKTGHWVTYDESHLEYTEEFDLNGQFIGGISYDMSGNSFPYTQTFQDAEYPGGDTAWSKFLKRKLNYPEEAIEKNIEGAVYLSFKVDKTGKIKDLEVVRGIHLVCDKEAYRVVSLSKNWIPAQKRGQLIERTMTLRIIFKLT